MLFVLSVFRIKYKYLITLEFLLRVVKWFRCTCVKDSTYGLIENTLLNVGYIHLIFWQKTNGCLVAFKQV